MKKFHTLFLCVFFADLSYAQDGSIYRDKFAEGNLLVLEGNYHEALKNFLLAYQIDSLNANINYKVGLCYLHSASDKDKAKRYLEKAVQNVSTNYTPDEPREEKAPIFAYKYLGRAYHLDYQFDNAIENYEKYRNYLSPKKHEEWVREIERFINMAKTARQLINTPLNVRISNLGDSINSAFPEYSPVITADESMLIFTSRRPGSTGEEKTLDDQFYEDIYVAYKRENGGWSSPASIGTNINSYGHESSIGLSADGQSLLIFKNDNGDGNIYLSTNTFNGFSAPELLGSDINAKSFETNACLSADGNTLYFVSDREGGLGGKDIWKCVKLPNGQWSLASNLGSPVNTEFDEECPFIHPDGVTLFFSSNGHASMGGYDIFFSTYMNDKWARPINIGYPINSPDDDLSFITSPDGKRGYFASERQGGLGDKDIYLVTLVDPVSVVPVTLLKGFLSFDEGKTPPDVRIVVTDTETGELIQEVRPNARTGKYVLSLAPGSSGKTYSITYEAQGYQPIVETLRIEPGTSYQEIDKELELELISFDKSSFVPIAGVVTGEGGKPLANVKILVKNNKNAQVLGTYSTDSEKGYYSFTLRKGKEVNISYEAEGYLFHAENIKMPRDTKDIKNGIEKNIVLKPVKPGSSIVLNNIFFDYNRSSLRKKSFEELDKLLKLLKDNPAISVEISGHADTRGNETFNLRLSEARAKAVAGYLFKKGVEEKRITAKGYGESVPLVKEEGADGKPDEKNMQQNRRVEFKIVE